MINRIHKINTNLFPEGFKPKILSDKPYLVKLRRFLNTKEVNTLLEMAEGKYEKSTIVLDDELTYSTTRTSETAYITDNGKIPKGLESITNKVCYLVGCKPHQIEGLMVVKYEPNQQYYNHHDYFEPEFDEMIRDGGQRISSFFCYLTSLEPGEGGETEFPLIDIKVKPSKGTSVFWWNTDRHGNTIESTLHRGNPVKSGVKYGLNIWIREHGWN